MTEVAERVERAGFELDGEFYSWSVTDQGKDLMLIDRFTQMPMPEFFQSIEDGFDGGRIPVLLAMIATSIRAGHPEWTVQRIAKLVEETRLTDVVMLSGDAEEDERPRPPSLAPVSPDDSEKSPSNGFSSSPTPAAITSYPT